MLMMTTTYLQILWFRVEVGLHVHWMRYLKDGPSDRDHWVIHSFLSFPKLEVVLLSLITTMASHLRQTVCRRSDDDAVLAFLKTHKNDVYTT